MDSDPQMQCASRGAAEEILRAIYGDDLEGCTVSLDRITEIISTAIATHVQETRAMAEVYEKGFEVIQLLSTPPANGQALGADELRSLLGERLDKIQSLASKAIAASKAQRDLLSDSNKNAEDADTLSA